ncbi:MAG: NAD-dependent deacylase [Planctomycetes bacterium]|nr:NAD-dependent deacylase [Planctomycetota bacterium]
MEPRIVVLTGAGVSADSGLATFRGGGGLWEQQRVEDVATPEAWARDPALVWRFYQRRRAALRDVEPNAAHHALARLERELAARGGALTLVSQNVDDLHQRAGSTVLAMHGQLARLRCEACGARVDDREHLDPARFVPCPRCAHPRLRPDVVWFGEMPLFLDEIEAAVRAAHVFLAAGTSGNVWPAAGYLALARAWSAETVVQALEPPANLDRADRFVGGHAAEALPRLVDEWLARWPA